VRRGQMRSEKDENGRLIVYLDEAELERNESRNESRDEYVSALKDQIELLRNELEDRKEESRRKDVLLMNLSEGIKQLNPPPPDSPPEQRDAPQTLSEEESGTGTQGRPYTEEEQPRRSWWRRMFIGE
jgi:hypothetical protein